MKRKAKERLGYAALNMAFVLLCAVTLVPIPVSYTHLRAHET